MIILTATADAGSTFTGWSGCDSINGNQCNVTMTAAKSVTALFNKNSKTLTVNKTGSGLITASSGSLEWSGSTGSALYDAGAAVTLQAASDAGYIFTGWSGACSGMGQCSVTMDQAKSVTATFAELTPAMLASMGRPIPDTGQTNCYNNSGEITCPAAGEAFYGQDGTYSINPPSYTKLDAQGKALPDDAVSWTMVRDNVTGLIWENKTSDGTLHDGNKTFTWCDKNPATNGGNQGLCGTGTGDAATDTEAYIKALNDANFGGFSDWRMPTAKELATIADRGRQAPTINTAWFPNMVSSYYWSSTTFASSSGVAWRAYFGSGSYVSSVNKAGAYAVRAVRGGQSGSLDHLVINGDDTVTDTATGLMWQQGTVSGKTWQDALGYAETISLAGYDDWRLPTLPELLSIADHNHYNPSIDSAIFTDTMSSYYWSSTTYADSNDGAWCVSFNYGNVELSHKPTAYAVRAVRGGQYRLLGNLVISAPGQADRWNIGEQKTIAWDTAGVGGDVKISLSRQGGKSGTFTETIAESVPNNGSYSWNVIGPASVNCVLRIEPLSDSTKSTTQGLFTIAAFTLTVSISGTGTGSVTANTGTLFWSGNTGTAHYAPGTPVTLTATATAGSIFSSWSGACSGTGTCQVTVSAAKSVMATFADTTPPTISISAWPTNYSNQSSGTIIFNVNETATFECKLDIGTFATCASPFIYNNLANEQHSVTICATDVAGNSATSTIFWTVNTILEVSSAIQLPQTGQTTCYDTSGSSISCDGTGQDGEIQAGVSWPNPRFTKPDGSSPITGDELLDNLTGLIWSKDVSTPTFAGSVTTCAGGRKTWQGALDYVKCLNDNLYLGYSDWRLPNINEISSLIHSDEKWGNWIKSQGFINSWGDTYWSSTTKLSSVHGSSTVNSDAAWVVSTNAAYMATESVKSYEFLVLPVRPGQFYNKRPPKTGQTVSYAAGDDGDLQQGIKWPDPRFIDYENQTIIDGLTGLTWTKDAKSPGPNVCNPGRYMSWNDAFKFISCLNSNTYLNHNDWRLPNIRELISLIDKSKPDYNTYIPLLPSNHPFVNVMDIYWSSNTRTDDFASNSWFIDFRDGNQEAFNKINTSLIWPVRGGVLINGRCGTSNGASLTDKPATNLCAKGTVSAVIGTGPWSWVCVGSNGGSTASCSASLQPSYNLTVTKSGAGRGTITPDSDTITWTGSNGTASYNSGTVVTLTAAADSGSTFNGWSGACAGTSTCQIIMDAAKSVTATFNDTTPPVTTPSVPTGSFNSAFSVTLSGEAGATVYYTLDGTDPKTSGTVQTYNSGSAIPIAATTTLKYYARDVNGNNSDVQTVTYTYDITPPTAEISDVPSSPSNSRGAGLSVGGIDVVAYKFKLDNGSYSDEQTQATPIHLISLADGTHTVSVIGRDAAGNWQSPAAATTANWTVDATAPSVSADPPGGSYSLPQSVELKAGEGATIYYTMDSSEPTEASTLYGGFIQIVSDKILKFFARDAAGNNSGTVTEPYLIGVRPVATAGNLTTDEDTPKSGRLTGTTAGGGPLTQADSFAIVRPPNAGQITAFNDATGDFTYRPNPNVNGSDSFTFKVRDSGAESEQAKITITINAVNDAPTAKAGAFVTYINTSVNLTLSGSDVDSGSLTYIILGPQNGTLTGTGANRIYTPKTGWRGTDGFTFNVSDGQYESGVAAIVITVTDPPKPNTPPDARKGSFQILEDTVLQDVLSANDADGDELTYRIVRNGGKGTARITDPRKGSFTYTPGPNLNGTDTFTFKANDGKADSNEATVTVTITSVNDPLAISGDPEAFVAPGSAYNFLPKITNHDATLLTFQITNKPVWADFDPDTGRLSGTPTVAGTVTGIVISVTDGVDTAALTPFSVTVLGAAPVTTISPKPKAYSAPQQITLTCQDAAWTCEIYYTINGAEPTIANSTKYTAPFTVSATTTVKYFAVNTANPPVFETPRPAVFTIDATPPTVAIASPGPGTPKTPFPEISGVASDEGSGLSTLTLKVHHLETGLYLSESNSVTVLTKDTASTISLNPSDGSWSYVVPSGSVNLPAGVYEITVEATDNGGNTAFQTAMFSYIDPTAQAYTELTLNLSSEAILENRTIAVSGRLNRRTDFTTPLAGQPVSLSVKGVNDSTIFTGEATTDQEGNYLFANVGGFSVKGQYSVKVAFTQTELLAGSEASDTLLVGKSAGYAVIVRGEIGSKEGLSSHTLTAARVKQHLLKRGFIEENIQYLQAAAKTAVQEAVSVWPRSKMNGSPAPFYLIMVDHGSVDAFHLNGTQTITPFELNEWLTSLEGSLNDEAKNEKRVVVLGACYSGSFIPSLSGAGRVIIASAASDEESFKGPLEGLDQANNPIRVGEFFLEELFKELGRGDSLWEAFQMSSSRTGLFTRRGSARTAVNNRYFDEALQHPLLDDDGDGNGSSFLSNSSEGQTVRQFYLGMPTAGVTDQPVEFTEVADTVYLGSNQTSATVWSVTADSSQVKSAWVEIRKPFQTLSASAQTVTGQRSNELVKILLAPANGRWEGTYDGFTDPGRYEVYYFMRYGANENLSPFRRSVFYKQKSPNNPPRAFQLLSPADGATQATILAFDWSDAIDPDDDDVTYSLVIAGDSAFSAIVYRQTDIAAASTYVDQTAKLQDRKTYYWKIEAMDAYGALRTSNVRSFRTDNAIGLPGVIKGIAFNRQNYTRLADVQIAGTSGGSVRSEMDGSFIITAPAGIVSLTGTLNGFEPGQAGNVSITAGQVTTVSMGLNRNSLTAHDLSITTSEDTTAAGSLTGVDGLARSLTFRLVMNGSNGTASIHQTTGAFTYTPNLNISGSDSFTFKVTAGQEESNIATVSVTILSANDAPAFVSGAVFNLDTVSPMAIENSGKIVADILRNKVTDTDGGASLQGMAITLTDNAHGAWQYSQDGGASWTDVGTVSDGTALLLAGDARLRFVPVAGYLGSAKITFRAWDQSSGTAGQRADVTNNYGGATAFSAEDKTVSIMSNTPPVAEDGSLITEAGQPKWGQMTARDADGQSLTYLVALQPGKGDMLFDKATGAFQYTPWPGVLGTDSFAFRVNDGVSDSTNNGTVTITINLKNTAPLVYDYNLSTPQNALLPLELTGIDGNGDELSYTIVSNPLHGTLTGTAPYFIYVPASGWTGDDSFTYRANDGKADSNTATVTITVQPTPNQAPVADTTLVFSVLEDKAFNGYLKATDFEGDALTYTLISSGGLGTASITNAGTGEFIYTPRTDMNGTDTFAYRVTDIHGGSGTATVTVNITPVPDPPEISGAPGRLARPGTPYSFCPTVENVDGTPPALIFSINRKPSWAVFGTTTGCLSGAPEGAAVTTAGIVISVSNGAYTASLPAFDLRTLADATKPASAASLAAGAYLSSRAVTLSCSDVGGGCTIYYSLDGTVPAVDDQHKYTGPITISQSATLKYFARDDSGNTEEVRTVIYTIDSELPEVSIVTPLDGAALGGGSGLYQISGQAADAGSGIASVQVQIFNGAHYLNPALNPDQQFVSAPVWISATITAAGEWAVYLPNTTWEEGHYSITARATDGAGNTRDSAIEFTYSTSGALKVYTQLTMELSSQAILQGEKVSVSGKLTRLPDTGISLAGRNLTLTIIRPDGSYANILQTATLDMYGHYIFKDVSGFDLKGLFTVTVKFAGTSLLAKSSVSSNVLSGASAGYALIVQGRSQTSEDLTALNLLTDRIHSRLQKRGFNSDNIKYLNFRDSAALPSKSAVQGGIEVWAKNLIHSKPAPFYVILAGPGQPGGFNVNGSESITPAELRTWLDVLRSSFPAAAQTEPQIVIIGADCSGSFIRELSAPDRVVITSARENEVSFAGPKEGSVGQEVRSRDLFLDQLFKSLEQGYSLKQSFQTAGDWTRMYTRRDSNDNVNLLRYRDNAVQHPLLDDNGDNKGVTVFSAQLLEGEAARHLYLGVGLTYDTNSALNPAEITSVTDTLTLGYGQSSALLWAKLNNNRLTDPTWVEIRPPSKTLTSGSVGLASTDLIRVEMISVSGRKEIQYDSFTESGKYELFYYVRDSVTRDIATLKRSVVYRSLPNNNPPGAFQLVEPANGSEHATSLLFRWTETVEPDNQNVTYNLIIAADSQFQDVVFRREEIEATAIFVDKTAGLKDLTTYYWKVEAVDAYGAVTGSSETLSFRTDNRNNIGSIITGITFSDRNLASINNATITAMIGSATYSTITGRNGNFALNIPSSSVLEQLTVTASGYGTTSVMDLPLDTGAVTNINLMLSSTNATKANQAIGAISFSPASLAVGGNTTVSASATSGLGVAFSSAMSDVCTLSATTVTGVTAGVCIIAADQSGNAIYNAAGQVNQNITVDKGTAVVALGSLNQPYDGKQKGVTATTNPFGLAVTFTYNGSATAPINKGIYTVVGTVNDANYQGSATDTLTIAGIPGDLDGSGQVDLIDAILAFQVTTRLRPAISPQMENEIGGNQKIGMEDIIYILQKTARLRP